MHNPANREEEDRPPTSLGLKTKLRLDIVIPLLTSVVSLTLIYAKLIAIEKNQQKAWTIQHQIMWSQQFALDNPTLRVPMAEQTVSRMNQSASP